MAQLAPVPKFRALDANGAPLAGGKVYTYQAGTSTPLATYTDKFQTTPNTNPVILDSRGEADVWLDGTNAYKIVLTNSADVTQWTEDNISPINDGSITTLKLSDGILANTTAGRMKMADGYLSASADGLPKMADGFLQNSASGRAKMADGYLSADTVGRAKMADGFLTRPKMAALGQQLSSSCGTFAVPFDGAKPYLHYDVTNLTVTITTSGRPVFLGMIADGVTPAYIGSTTSSYGDLTAFVFLGSASFQYQMSVAAGVTQFLASKVLNGPWTIETPLAGTYTYKVSAQTPDGIPMTIANWKLIAFEL